MHAYTQHFSPRKDVSLLIELTWVVFEDKIVVCQFKGPSGLSVIQLPCHHEVFKILVVDSNGEGEVVRDEVLKNEPMKVSEIVLDKVHWVVFQVLF